MDHGYKKRNDGKRKQLTHIKNTSYAPPPPYKNLCMGQLIYFAIFFIVRNLGQSAIKWTKSSPLSPHLGYE